MSELNIHQILSSNYYKKPQEWWTDDVDGYCFIFRLYRNTENSLILLKRWREISEKKSTARFFNNVLIRRVTQIEWSFSKEQNNGSAYETKIEDKVHQFNYFFEFDTNTNSIIVRIYFNRLSKTSCCL